MRTGIFRNLVALAAVGLSAQAYAGTEADYQALRSWCVQRDAHHNDAAWQSANSPIKYFHYHHYCNAMRLENRLITPRDARERSAVISDMFDNLSYVIKSVQEPHFLLPEVYALRGRALYVGKRYAEAETDFLNALQRDPKHARAAAYLATLYMDTNRRPQAVEVVRASLAQSPGDYRLRQLGKELKIELPPERPAAVVESTSSGASTQPAESAAAKGDAAPSELPANANGTDAAPEAPTTGCRFCPPEGIQSKWRESFREKPKQ